jgi:hypothetical protein
MWFLTSISPVTVLVINVSGSLACLSFRTVTFLWPPYFIRIAHF